MRASVLSPYRAAVRAFCRLSSSSTRCIFVTMLLVSLAGVMRTANSQYYEGKHPWATTDHKLDVFAESGDKETMPVTDPDEWKPTKTWAETEKKRAELFNTHPVPPHRVMSEKEIYRVRSNEDPSGELRVERDLEGASTNKNPKNHQQNYNREADGISDYIGAGAHKNGGVDAMIEPYTEDVEKDSSEGGAHSDNTNAMRDSAKLVYDEDKEGGGFKEDKQISPKPPKEDLTKPQDVRNEEQAKREHREAQLEDTRKEGEMKRREGDSNRRAFEEKRKQQYSHRPKVKKDEFSAAQILLDNQHRLENLNKEEDIDGNVQKDEEIESKKKNNAKLRSNTLEMEQTRVKEKTSGDGGDSSGEKSQDDPERTVSAEESIGDESEVSKKSSLAMDVAHMEEDAPKPGQRQWIRTDPDNGATYAGGAGYLFQECRKGAAGMCWLPYKCLNHGGTVVKGKCYGGGDTACCQGYQTRAQNPLPLVGSIKDFPSAMYEGKTVRLSGERINIGEREQTLFRYMKRSGIGGVEAAQFLAQMDHESHHFQAMEEYASGNAYEGRVDLGNVQRGDGAKYKGRGYIQLTGRANYRYMGQVLGVDLEKHPEMAGDLDIAAQVAVNYWYMRVKSSSRVGGDFTNTKSVTYLINGGSNGLADRKKKFAAYKSTLRL